MTKKKTQLERIKRILITRGKIDNFSAINTRLTLRLGGHIHILRCEGWDIKTERKKDRNCVYRLIQANDMYF